MREILFRGKRADTKEWIFGSLIVFPDGDTYIASYTNSDYTLDKYQVIPETVGQFTALYDKEENKIFEGDILKNVETGEIGYVDYDWHGCPNFVVETDDGCLHYTTLFIETPDDDMEIIGNKSDNPKLIPIYKESEYQRY